MTQILTKHRCFSNFLCRIKKIKSKKCAHCVVDNAQHTLAVCDNEKKELVTVIGQDLFLQIVIGKILQNND